jgi:hypothetical protein
MTWEALDIPVDRSGTGSLISSMPEKAAESDVGRADRPRAMAFEAPVRAACRHGHFRPF